MEFWGKLILFFDSPMEEPQPYGWFHLFFVALSIAAGVLLCVFFKKGTERQVRAVLLTVSIAVIVLEIYKQLNYTFAYENGVITADYQWYAFPWQFCSTPMLISLLAGLVKKGKIHDALCSYLATFAVFAGLVVMVYPNTVFIDTIGINIQTMICHGSMITVGIYLLYTQYVKIEAKTVLKAIPVFCVCVAVAMIMNEIAFRSGLLETDTFNMFFISPHCEPSLPVYSIVQGIVPFPFCLLIYIAGFTLAAYIVMLVPIIIKKIKCNRG